MGCKYSFWRGLGVFGRAGGGKERGEDFGWEQRGEGQKRGESGWLAWGW